MIEIIFTIPLTMYNGSEPINWHFFFKTEAEKHVKENLTALNEVNISRVEYYASSAFFVQ